MSGRDEYMFSLIMLELRALTINFSTSNSVKKKKNNTFCIQIAPKLLLQTKKQLES